MLESHCVDYVAMSYRVVLASTRGCLSPMRQNNLFLKRHIGERRMTFLYLLNQARGIAQDFHSSETAMIGVAVRCFLFAPFWLQVASDYGK